jgi:trafficking protein particle complex subunit 9
MYWILFTNVKAMFSPAQFPNGTLLLDMSTSDVTTASRYLVPFELFRQPLIVIGIADGPQCIDTGGNEIDSLRSGIDWEEIGEKLDWLREEHQTALVHKIFVFDCNETVSESSEDIIPISTSDQPKPTVLYNIMCDVTAHFLEELSSYARSVQALPNIETPTSLSQGKAEPFSPRSSSLNDQSRPGSGVPSPAIESKDGIRSPYRASMPAHIMSPLGSEMSNGDNNPSQLSSPDIYRPPTTFDDIHVDRPLSASSTDKARNAANRVSVHGFGSGTTGERARNQAKGRLGVVIGSMYLLAGRWPEAIRELVDSATIAKWSNDHAWYAKSLDYILVGLLMCGWAGLDFEVILHHLSGYGKTHIYRFPKFVILEKSHHGR